MLHCWCHALASPSLLVCVCVFASPLAVLGADKLGVANATVSIVSTAQGVTLTVIADNDGIVNLELYPDSYSVSAQVRYCTAPPHSLLCFFLFLLLLTPAALRLRAPACLCGAGSQPQSQQCDLPGAGRADCAGHDFLAAHHGVVRMVRMRGSTPPLTAAAWHCWAALALQLTCSLDGVDV